MGTVVALASVRNGQNKESQAVPYHTLSHRIDLVAHRYVSLGAVVLLRQLALLIEEGSPAISYTKLIDRLRVTRATLSRYVDELEDARMLKVRRSRVGKQNATNHFEIDFRGPLGDDMSALKISKKRRAAQVENDGENPVKRVVQKSNYLVQKVDGYKEDISNRKGTLVPKGTGRSATGFDSVEEAIQASSAKTEQARATRLSRTRAAPGGQLTLAGVKAEWTTAMRKHHPRVPPVVFTAKEFAIFKHKVRPLLSIGNLSGFFDWVVAEWATLRETNFKWLRAKGEDVALAPSMFELMRYWKVFATAYANSRMEQANSEDRRTVSEADALAEELRTAKAALAKERAAKEALATRTRRAERIAYGREQNTEQPKRSLSERMRKLDESYNPDDELPQWEDEQ